MERCRFRKIDFNSVSFDEAGRRQFPSKSPQSGNSSAIVPPNAQASPRKFPKWAEHRCLHRFCVASPAPASDTCRLAASNCSCSNQPRLESVRFKNVARSPLASSANLYLHFMFYGRNLVSRWPSCETDHSSNSNSHFQSRLRQGAQRLVLSRTHCSRPVVQRFFR